MQSVQLVCETGILMNHAINTFKLPTLLYSLCCEQYLYQDI